MTSADLTIRPPASVTARANRSSTRPVSMSLAPSWIAARTISSERIGTLPRASARESSSIPMSAISVSNKGISPSSATSMMPRGDKTLAASNHSFDARFRARTAALP